jgi:hypothetical protein
MIQLRGSPGSGARVARRPKLFCPASPRVLLAWLAVLAVVLSFGLPGGLCSGEFGSLGFGISAASAESPTVVRAPADLAALMRGFAESGTVRARFRETRHLKLLAQPIASQGSLYFAPPDRLARLTLAPAPSSVVVQGGKLALRDDQGHRLLDLDRNEIARDLVGTLITVLRGDLPALRERYSLRYSSKQDRWTLDLEPRSRQVRRLLDQMRLSGRGADLSMIERFEAGGDTTVTEFYDVETGVEFDAALFERIFSLEAPPASP